MAETAEHLAALDLAWTMGVIPKTGEKVYFFFAPPGRAFFMANLLDPLTVLDYAERARKDDGRLYIVAARTVKDAREKLRGQGTNAQYGIQQDSKADNVRSDIVHNKDLAPAIDDYNAAVVTRMPRELQQKEFKRYVAILEERVKDVVRGDMPLPMAVQLLSQYVRQQHAAIEQLYPVAVSPLTEGVKARWAYQEELRRKATQKAGQVSLFTQEWADSSKHRPTAAALEELGPDRIPSPEGSKEQLAGLFSRIRELMDILDKGVHPSTGRALSERQTQQVAEEVVNHEAMYEAGYNQYADAYGWEHAEELHEEIENEWDATHGVVHAPHPASFEPPEQLEELRRMFRVVRAGQAGNPEIETLRTQMVDALLVVGDTYGLQKQRELEFQLEQEYLGNLRAPAPSSKKQRSLLEFGSDSGLTPLWPRPAQSRPSPMPSPAPRPIRRRPGQELYRVYVSDPLSDKKAEWFWSWVHGYELLPALTKATGYEVVNIDRRLYLLMFETPDRAEAVDTAEELQHSQWGAVRIIYRDRPL